MTKIKIEKHSLLEVDSLTWQVALVESASDDVVNIIHAEISGNEESRVHVAEIPDKVGCHFHSEGNEDYSVVGGRGTLFYGEVIENETEEHSVSWEEPLDVETGDSFVIPEGYAHQLRRSGNDPLIILFCCPDTHLNDDKDRTMLPDAPYVDIDTKKLMNSPGSPGASKVLKV